MDTAIASQSQLDEFYSNLHSRRVDLVGDYAGSEPFLIEGDSLLLHCFSNQKLDFQDGFQMLHAVWIVEYFLNGLRQRKCNFHLVFFDEHAELCIPSHADGEQRAKYRLARAVILRHFEANLGSRQIKVTVFPSLSSAGFISALSRNDYIFIMMNDGASANCKCCQHVRDRSGLRVALCAFLAKGYNVALVNGLEWRDTKVIAAVIEGPDKRRTTFPCTSLQYSSKEEDKSVYFDPSTQEILSRHHVTVQQKLSERLYLAATVAGILLSTDAVDSEAVVTFLTHAAFQGQLRLASRATTVSREMETSKNFLKHFTNVVLSTMKSSAWRAFIESSGVTCDIADLVDGRLFNMLSMSNNTDNIEPMTKETLVVLESLLTLASSISQTVLRSQLPPKIHQKRLLSHPSHASSKLLPFSNPVFDKHLEPIRLEIDALAEEGLVNKSSQVYDERTHWHSAKRPLNVRTAIAPQRVHRRNQQLMAEMMVYAASLNNAVAKTLEPEVIILRNAKVQAPHQDGAIGKAKKQPGGRQSKKQAILDQLAAEKARKDEFAASKMINSWHLVCQGLEREPDISVRHAKALQYLTGLPEAKMAVVGTEVGVYALNCLVKLWKASTTRDPESPDYGIAAMIWDAVSRLRNVAGMTPTVESKLRHTVDSIGLPFAIDVATRTDRKLPFEFALYSGMKHDLRIPLPPKEFQLLHCGLYFDRKLDSAPDDRVPFQPDGWQRKVLDVIDADKSLFVVAPTSAGKTFISFYAMKKVLESSDEGVLVYVAPTKALVNQIAAEIQARFSKSYKHAGRSVWGIHTRDYRVNSATGCQILVTVPHILQIMLLAPSNAESWSKNIKRIIFDEVHCIGQVDDGVVWEQLLLLSPCPIIALSATVGNPEEFHTWLASAQKAIGTELVMVHHPHRYSDLRKLIYKPPHEFSFTGLPKAPVLARIGLEDVTGFESIHPVASLVNRSRGIPEDFSLEARDCLTLWKAMKTHETDFYKVDESLSPDVALPDVITQADIITWSQALKQTLKHWMAEKNSPFDHVVQDLSSNLYDFEKNADVASRTSRESKGYTLSNTTLPLLYHLHEQSALPAILFNYDRSQCEKICHTVLDQLQDAEEKWRGSEAWKTKLSAWDEWKKKQKKASKKAASKKGKGLRDDDMTKADIEREAASYEPDPWASFDPDAPLDSFSFANKAKTQQSELDEYAKELKQREVAPWLIKALYRGIAVHHAGMNRKYRHVIEVLFRSGYLRVVIATGTLALGINMPCKTVVFSGDSVFLTALNYRQAAGRAGRRGFDVLGNVVFHGVSTSKVCRLLSSRLPDLTGHFPITTTLVLRLCTLLSASDLSPFAVRAVDALLSQPRLYLGGTESRMTVLHHLRFSVEYLRRQCLLDRVGTPLNFAGCVSHLYFTENSNFAFHALLKDGYFHELCNDIHINPQRVLRTLMLVLSHLFGRQYCRQADKEFIEHTVRHSPSVVFLPRLPEKAAVILREHNSETLRIFTDYVRTFVEQHVKEDDCFLPLSGMKFGGDSGSASASESTIRSHFVALSGHGDEFQSVSELCQTVRAGVFLEEAVIPNFPMETELPLNAYLYDFFMHGDITALTKANRIRKGDMWFLLNDFSLILAAIITSLTNFIKQAPGADDTDMLDTLGAADAHEEEMEDGIEDALSVPQPAVMQPQPQTSPACAKRSGISDRDSDVAENWDDDVDEAHSSDQSVLSENTAKISGLGEGVQAPAWEHEGKGKGSLLDVLEAFRRLSDEFNGKFREMWA